MIEIDGSHGEGGGAILRQALGLAIHAGVGLRVRKIRAGRDTPGLKPQHLTAVRLASAICGAEVEGAEPGSTELAFEPGPLRSGTYAFDIGTAGSTTLLLQTVLVPCLFADGEFRFELTGGTDVAWSPPADYLDRVTFAVLRRFGRASLEVERRGYYPKGGGRIRAHLGPRAGAGPVSFEGAPAVERVRGISHAGTALESRRVAERQAETAREALGDLGVPVEIAVEYSDSRNPGSGITLWAEPAAMATGDRRSAEIRSNPRPASGSGAPGGSAGSTGEPGAEPMSAGSPPAGFAAPLGGSCLGARGVPAEEVGREAANALRAEIQSGGGVDRYLADQLVPFMAVIGGAFTTSDVTLHTRSNIHVAERILGARFEIRGKRVGAAPAGRG